MGTVFLTNLAAVAGKYERYDVLSAIFDFQTHNRLPLKKLRILKNLKENPAILILLCFFYSHFDDFLSVLTYRTFQFGILIQNLIG